MEKVFLKVARWRERRNAILMAAERAAHVAFVVALFHVIALVEKFFPLGERDFDFDQAVAKIKFGRHDGFSAGADFGDELADFARVQEKFSRAVGLVIIGVPEVVFGNVSVVKNRDRAVIDADKRVGDICASEAHGFDFRSRKRNARFKAALEKIISRGFRVADFRKSLVVFFFAHEF